LYPRRGRKNNAGHASELHSLDHGADSQFFREKKVLFYKINKGNGREELDDFDAAATLHKDFDVSNEDVFDGLLPGAVCTLKFVSRDDPE